MGTKITKGNAESAIKDDKAHIDYLKQDVNDDQKSGGEYKDIDQTADEIHISKLAGDIKADGHFLSKHWSHNKAFSNPSPHDHEGGPEVFDHSWGGESVELQDQGSDSPLHQAYDPDKFTEGVNVTSAKKAGNLLKDYKIPKSTETTGSVKDPKFS